MEGSKYMSQPVQKLQVQDVCRVAILQRVCTGYRKGLFQKISENENITLRVFIGDDIPNSKVKSTQDLTGIDVVKLPTKFIQVGRRIFVSHINLQQALNEFEPDVIICEGESNLLSYLKAIIYKWQHPAVKLIHWSLGGLPGEKIDPQSIKAKVKSLLHKPFDCFIAYSSYGKTVLKKLGRSAEHIVVATNVSDTDYHLERSSQLKLTTEEAREQLGLPDRYTALYVGAIDDNKRLGILVKAAEKLDRLQFNVVIVGDGEYLQEIKKEVESNNINNVYLPGRVSAELATYYRAADVFVLPGRGGMVISEAMAYGLPVIVFQADGTEYDLVENNKTGVLLKTGSVDELAESINKLSQDTQHAKEMGQKAQQQVREQYNRAAMVSNIISAINIAATADKK